MNKTQIALVSIFVGLTLIVIGGIYISLENNRTKPIIAVENSNEEIKEEQLNETQYQTKEEALEEIKKSDSDVHFSKEENGCWYYTSKKNEYMYCIGSSEIVTITSTTIIESYGNE